MATVSDTSPISNLAFIERLSLLKSQFQEVYIPEAVLAELGRMPNPEARSLIEQALHSGWLRCRAVTNKRLAVALTGDLDDGEAEAIVLATEIGAEVLLIDEKEGRNFARQAGIPVRGVLGVLIRAKATGDIRSVKAEINALRDRARFFVAPLLEAEVLRSVGE
jgi:predicted nucleic acid-binding protein